MVRETRHLWVGNLPDNIREERIREHFKRYGRVQSVKLLARGCGVKEEAGEGTMACTVAFMDIKSASKAHNVEHKIDDRTLTTEYYEPAAIPSAASPQNTTQPSSYNTSPASTRFPNGHGSADEHSNFSERFYERGTTSGGGGGGGGGGRGIDGEFIRRSAGYHETSRGRNRDRAYRSNGPYNSGASSAGGGVSGGGGSSGGLDGGRSSHRAAVNNTSSWSSYDSTRYGASQTDTGYASAPSEGAERRTAEHAATKKKAKSRSGSGSPSPSGSTSSRSPSRSRSRSSSSSSSSSTSRDTSSTGSPKSRRLHSLFYTEDRRPLAICVRNLPIRSSDTSLKDGLFHEYKKHGKVTWVKMVGQSLERYAIVCFKKPQDVEKALEVSYDKLFFGCKIEVGPYQGYDDIYMEETDFRPYEAEIDEFHPKATRTLFIGNLEKDVTASDLRKHFDQFGEIIEIDIKKQGTVGSYAFCQYTDIGSVVQAIRKMDGEHLGNNRIKLGFGKSMPTGCVWVDGIVENVNEKYLKIQFEPFGTISKVHMDRERGQALMFYDQVLSAQTAVNKMRGFSLKGSKIQVDFASRECQEAFFEHLDKQGTVIDRAVAFDERRESASRTFEAATTRFASRYDTPTRPRTSSYSSRSSAVAAGQVASAVPSPGTPGSMTPRGSRRAAARYAEYYEQQPAAEYADRHFRSYDEYSQGSAASHEDAYDHEYVYNHDSPSSHQDAVPAAVAGGAANGGVESAAVAAATPFAPPDIRNLQKERVHLLEQLEECPSSGDELLSPKKRLKLDVLDGGAVVVTSDVIIEANRDHRKVMEVRRLSDVSVKHHSRRPSADGKHSSRGEPGHDRGSSSYLPHAVCKRRKTAGSDGGCTNTNATTTTTTGGSSSSRTHHYDHSGSESAGGSRPGTPLCDERPDHFPPAEPRRTPRDREGPLSLPLPRFASQLMLGRGGVSVAGVKGQAPSSGGSPPAAASASAAATSPRTRPPSPVPVPPPASPPPRPPSLSPDSSDSDGGPPSPSLDERIRSLDEKYEKWSGSRALGAAAAVAAATQGGDALAKLDATRERFRRKHNLLDLDLKEVQPSEIVKSVLAKRSVFDEDSKRLENVGEKYEPKEFGLLPRVTTTAAAVVQQATATAAALTAAAAATAAATAAAAAAAAVSATPPVVKVVTAAQLSTTMLSPRSAGATITPAKGLQYPFPSHPLPQTTLSSLPGTSTAPAVSTATTTLLTTSASTASTTNRGVSSHGENRLKPCVASVSSDNRTTSKVTVNRNVVVSNATSKTIEKTIEKPSPNIPNTSETSSAVVAISKHTRDAKSAEKGSEKITCRRDSNSSSPRGDIKTRRNSDTSTRKVDEAEKYSEHTTDNHKQDERAKEEEHKEQLRLEKIKQDNERLEREKLEKEKAEKERLEKERQEKERLEKERLEKERLEKERQEKERLERQRQERERQERERLEKERLEKQRLEKEEAERQLREKLEKERLAKEKAEKEKAEQEKREKEKQEQERIERERRKEREERERLERERYERELREKAEREKQEQLKREREEKERVERERLEKERFERIEREKHEREKKHKDKEEDRKQKDDNHHDKQRKDDHRNHSEQLKENNFDKHSHDTKNTKDNKEDKFNTELHEKSKHDRKDHVKENRDSNLFRNLVTEIREGKDRPDKPMVESRHMSIDYDKSKSDKLDSGRRKDKYNNLQPSVGSKRRMSSHDISESFDEAKRFKLNQEHKKLSERRDSKDSTRSDEKSKSKHKNNSIKLHDEKSRSSEKTNHVKNSEEKRKEKDRDKEERHKLKHQQKLEKQKSKTKNRERDLREWRESPNTQKSPPKDMTDTDFMARLDLQLTSDIEKHKQQRKELKDGKKLESSEPEEKKDEKRSEERTKKEKHSSDKNKIRDDSSTKALNDERKSQKKGKIKKLLQNSSDNNTDSDEPKKHSIFDIVDDEPAYISMYDKVKARSCKNMQKQEEEKRQEKIKAKFSQLKQSRAKREEKKRSTSWDEDSDSDREKSDMKLKRALQALIISSDDDDHMIRKLHKKVDMFTDSDSDVKAKPKVKQLEVSDDEKIKSKHKPKSCITSDTLKVLITSSDDDDQIIRKLHKKVDIFTDSDSDVRGKAKVKQLGVSDDEKMKSKHKPKSRITSDTSDDEFKKIQSQMKTEMFSDNEVDQGFADSEEKAYNKVKEEAEKTIKKERKNKHLESLEEQINAQIFGDSSSPFPEIKTEKFNNKHFDNSSADESMEVKKERSEIRKKHKKKQKRQKHSLSSEESKLESLGESMHSESSERSKIHEKKKQHSKKDKKRDKSKDERDKTKKKKNKAESKESKRDGKIENIFGSFSEDSETGIKDQTEKANVPQPWEESRMERIKKLKAYLSDSECEHYNHEEKERDPKEEHKKRKEKKRREKERRLQEAAAAAAAVEPGGTNENSMDFADMGKQVEENIKENSTDALEEVSRCTVENSVQGEDEPQTFPESSEFHEIKKEEKREGREKKKKRKKSKEEKQKHHHHHHEKKNKSPELKREHSSPIKETSTKEVQEAKTDLEETKPHSQSLPTLLDSPTTPTSTSKSSPHLDFYMSPFRNEPLVSPIPKTPTSSKERVREKLIPGFGADIDEKIHENAVKSISAFEAPKPEVAVPPTEEEEKPDKAEETPEEKPRVIISQEETEDAVAALLGESFRKDQFDECYNEESSTNDPSSTLEEENIVQDDEEMRQAVQSLSAGDIDAKPDTPQSEHELQIDTDTEEQEEIPVRADQSSKPLQVGQRPVSPKSTGVSSYYQKTPPLLIKTTDIGSPPSLAPITPSKSLQPAIIAEVKRTIEIPEVPKAAPVCSEQSRSVISWSKESKEAISCKAEDIKKSEELPTVKTVTPSSAPTKTIIASSPLRTYGSTPVVKLAEPIYPPLTALSSKPETEPPQRPEQGTPMPSLQPMAKTSSPSVHILPARSPVPPKSPITSLHQETSALLTPKTTIANLSFNRLPVTPVMISKPLQSTTINLPQPKVAHSIEHAKLVPITEGKAHERPRLLYQNATNVKAKLTPYVHPQPRMVVQPIQITLPPQGLLVPARPLPSNHMNYLNNVLPTLAHSPVAKENISPLPDKQATSTSLAESAKTTTSAAFTTASQAGNIQTKQVTTEAKGPSKVNTVTSTVTSTTMTAKLFSPVIHELPPKLIITSPTITPQEVTDNNKKPQIEVQSVISSAKNECLNTTPVIQAILPKTSEPPSLQPISQPVVSKVVATAVSEIPVGNNLSPKDIGCKDNQKAPAEVPKCLVPGTVIVAADQKESVKETPKEDSKVAEEPSHLAIEKVTEQLNLTLKKENDDDHPVPEEKLVIPENIISEVKPEVKPESLSTKDTEIVDVKQSVDDTKSVEAKSVDVKSAQVKPVEVKSAQVKSVEVKSVEVKSVEIKPVEIKPVDIKPVEIKPVDIKPVVEVKSVEVKSVEAKSVEAKSAEIDLKVEPVEPEIKSEIIDTKPLTSDILDDMKKEDVTKEEIKAEPSDNKSVISEADSGISSSAMKESDKFDEEKADTESIISDISKERSSAELGMKYDPLDSKEDSDYWSAKEVNIDSVIKILCSADELSNHSSDNGKDEWFDNVNKESQEKLKEVKSVITENPLENDLDAKKTEENSESVPKPDQENLNDSAESIEDKDVTTSLRSSRSRGGRGRRGKARGGIERVGVQTRRAKVIKEPVTPSKRGGRNAAKTKVERRASKSDSDHTADVYEFRDDSDENNPNKERPRLILTIKSPSISGTNNTQTTIVKEVVKEITTPPNQPKTTPENKEEFLSPINTRKSRRLQERDGSRNTVDDTIEDVVKNTRFASNNAQTPCTRRSTRQVAAKTPPQETAARKSPRSARRRDRRGSEANEETPEEKDKVVKSDVLGAKAESEPQKEPEKPKDIVATTEQHSPKEEVPVPLKEKPHVSLKAAVLRRVKGELQQEPMTLIDPVTGLLTPMRECEEGRYIPVPGEQKQAVSNAQTSVVTPNVVAVSQPQRPVPKSVITLPQQQQPQPAPAPQPAVPPQVQAQNPPQPVISKPKPQSLKAHVLSSQAAKAVVQTSVPQPQKAAAITPQPTPPMIITKASTPISQHLNINVSISNHTQSQASPRQQTVPLKVVTKVALQVKPPKGSPCQVVSFTNQQKQQILQQVKQPTTMVTKPHLTTPIIPSHQQVINTQMAHMKHTPPQLVMQQVLAKGHITKASALPMHQQQMLAGAAASPPPLSKTASQPIPTAVSSARILPVSAKGVMEPPKVDVSVSNIILGQQRANLSPQGQPRHVVQPGMSVPGYEASLHGDRSLYNRSRSPPPAHQNSPSPQGEAIAHFPPGSVPLRPPHDLPAAHYMHPSHVMQYQQFLRQSYSLPRSPMVPGGLEKAGDGQEGEEAPVTSPPLELRRAGSVGLALTSRSAAVPHGLHSPHDRATDSPQVGQVYNMHTARMQHYHPNRFFEQTAEPPPAHRPLTSHGSLAALGGDLAHMGPLAAAASVADRPLGGHVPERPLSSHSAISSHLSTPERPLSSHGLALGAGLGAAGNLMGAVARHVGVDAPATQRGLQAATPPHASQVPPQAESLFMLLKQYPCMWQGLLALKNDQAAVQMYFVSGNEAVAKCSLPKNTDGSTPPLRIFQRMRLEPPQVEGVARKMQMENEHCMLLALPCGHDHMDVLKQSTNLTNGFITYLQQKQAAGIVNVAAPGTTQPPAYVVHIFPSCDFVNDNLRRIAPSLLERVADIAHLLIVITTV